ncbi:TPA: hypothetical protein EYP75_05590 [Candidatus Bathyarchaeota archaeon]|nr:hypothetical protein [Candidatus Bathyarchaeota archaeon]
MEKKSDAEELQEILKAVSEQIPALIRGIIGSIFSAEAGRNMGASAANFYKELKAGGIPDEVAIKMTQDYIKTFTDLGDLLREVISRKGGFSKKHGKELKETISEAIKEKIEKGKAGELYGEE